MIKAVVPGTAFNVGGERSVHEAAQMPRVVPSRRGPRPAPAMEAVAARYVADVQSRCAPRHAENVRISLGRVLAIAPTLKPVDVLAFRRDRLLAGASNRTVNLDVGAARALTRWASGIGLLDADPLVSIRPLPQRQGDLRRRTRALSDDEISRFVAASVEVDADRPWPLTLLWRLLIETGMRWAEASMLAAEHLERDAIYLAASGTKARCERIVPLSHVPALLQALRLLPKDGLWFRTMRGEGWSRQNHSAAVKVFAAILKRAAIARKDGRGRVITIHALRATAATRMLRRGVQLATVAAVLGHADTRTLMRHYADLSAADTRAELVRAWKNAK